MVLDFKVFRVADFKFALNFYVKSSISSILKNLLLNGV